MSTERALGDLGDSPQRRRHRRWPWITLLIVVLAFAGAAAWLGSRALTVKTELEASQASVAGLRGGGDLSDGLRALGGHAARAEAAASDPVWRAAEVVPIAGDNLLAVRLACESLDLVSNQLAIPVLDGFNSSTEPLRAAVSPLQRNAAALTALSAQVEAVRSSPHLIAEVSSGLDQVAEVLASVRPVAEILPGMAGADGPRNYLVVGQTNAESLALGGSAASTTLMRVENGSIKLIKQADSGDFERYTPLDFDLPASTEKLYGTVMRTAVNATVSRPDFPTAAKLITGLWQRDIHDDQIDGVLSIDPIALSFLLEATGPVVLPNGEQVTSANVVKLTLKEVYDRYADPEQQDAYLKVVSQAVFAKLAAGEFQPSAMLAAVNRAIDRGSLMFWSADAAVQARTADLPIAGILPTTNQPNTVLGVFFRDYSMGSKIDYYLRSSVDVTTRCEAGVTTYTVKTTLHLDLSAAAEAALPDYVNTNLPGGAYRTQIFVYGPPGSTVSGVKRGDRVETHRKAGLEDLGRPVASFNAITHSGQSATVTTQFVLDSVEPGPVAVRTTPMVKATEVSVGAACLAAR